MEIDDIPGNRKGAPKKVAPTEEPRPKVARTVQGAVTKRKKPLGKRTTAYVCTNYLCRLPTSEPAKVAEMLR